MGTEGHRFKSCIPDCPTGHNYLLVNMEKVVESTEGKTKTDEEVAQEEVDEEYLEWYHTHNQGS